MGALGMMSGACIALEVPFADALKRIGMMVLIGKR